jgi:hypothetical protein
VDSVLERTCHQLSMNREYHRASTPRTLNKRIKACRINATLSPRRLGHTDSSTLRGTTKEGNPCSPFSDFFTKLDQRVPSWFPNSLAKVLQSINKPNHPINIDTNQIPKHNRHAGQM